MANEFKIRKGLIVEGASSGTVVNVLGSQGQLFSVTDDLSGDIFAVSDISGVPIFTVNSSGLSTFTGLTSGITPVNAANFVTKAYVDGSGGGTGPFLPLAGGTLSGPGNLTIGGTTTLSSTLPLLYLTNTTASTGKNWRLSSATNGKFFIAQEGVVDALSLDHTSGNATFAGTVTANSYFLGSGSEISLATTGAGSVFLRPNGQSTSGQMQLASTGNATFAGKATSSATTASDGSTTLTTKSYVDGLVTGVPVYKGTWAAGTTGVTSAAISSTTITLTAAPTETIAIGDVVTADGITAAITVTAVGSQTSVTVNASVTIASGVTVTFSSSNGGYPDLTLNANKVLGNYYIVSTAGSAAPNGSGVEPDSWAVGDWCIFSDVTPGAGTDLWQRIDNSSVISGAGTGGTIPLWEGATNAVSETLTDSPITVSGNNSTFASAIGIGGITPANGYMVDIAPTGGNIIRSTRGTSVFGAYQSNNSDVYLGTISNNTFKIITNDGTAVTIGANNDAVFAGNVTIGDNSASEIFLAFNSSSTDFALGANGSNFMIGTSSDLDSGNLITLSGLTGNFGIGVTGPSTKLEVAGHVTINSPAGASQTSYGLRLRKTNSSSAVQAGGEILASPYSVNTNAANLIFKTANTSANLTQRMVIDGVGNVGIGTASPTGYRLVVENTSEDLLKLHNSTDGLDSLISFTNPGGTLARIQGIDNGGLGFDVGNNAGGIISNAMLVML